MTGTNIEANRTQPLRLKQRVLAATGIIFSGFALSQLIRLVGNIITTRLLAPELFGVMALANAFVTAAVMLSDTGLTSNILRHRDGERREFLQTAFSITVMQGSVIALAVVLIGIIVGLLSQFGYVPASSVYADDALPTATAILAASIFIRSFSSIEIHVCRRRLQLGKVIFLEIACQLISILFVITYALHDPSIYALAIAALVSAVAFTIGSYLLLPSHNRGFGWHAGHAREMFHYGKWITGSSAIGLISQHADKLVFGILFTATQMGHYAVASLIFVAGDAILNKLNELWLPVFGEMARSHKQRIVAVYYRIRLARDCLVAIIAGPLLMAGDLAIQILYDDRYAESGWMLQLLSISFFIDAFRSVKEKLVMAKGDSNIIFKLSILRSVSTLVLIFIFFNLYGIPGAVFAYSIRLLPGTIALFLYFKKHGLLQIVSESRTLLIAGAGIIFGLFVRFLLEQAMATGWLNGY